MTYTLTFKVLASRLQFKQNDIETDKITCCTWRLKYKVEKIHYLPEGLTVWGKETLLTTCGVGHNGAVKVPNEPNSTNKWRRLASVYASI